MHPPFFNCESIAFPKQMKNKQKTIIYELNNGNHDNKVPNHSE